jgi:hypothetical protein
MAETRWDVFVRYQWVLAALHLLSATAFLIIVSLNHSENDWKVDVLLSYNKWVRLEGTGDGQCTQSNPCFIRQFVDTNAYSRISLGVAVSFCSFISGLHHLFAALYEKRYRKVVETGIVWPRWIDYAFSSPVMFLVVAILWVSPPDIRDVIYVFTIQALVIMTGYGAECMFACVGSLSYAPLHQWTITGFGVAAHATVWAYLFRVYSAASESAGELTCDKRKIISEHGGNLTDSSLPVFEADPSEPPPWVNVILFFIFSAFSSFAVNHIYKLSRTERSFDMYLFHEAIYSGLSFTSKIVLLGTMAASISTRSDGSVRHENDYSQRNEEDKADDNSAYIGFAISATIAVVLCCRFGYVFSMASRIAKREPSGKMTAVKTSQLVF